jgi:hypothetical protein
MVLSASASVKPVARVVHTKRLAGINVPLSTLSSSSSSTAKATCGPAQLRRWCGEVKVRDFGGECWRLVIPSAAYRLLLRTPSPARPAGAQLLAKDRKHAENRLPPPPASRCASSSSRERASRRVRAHTSSTDPPRPSGTPPTTSSAGVAAATATCCRSRASSSPCRRSAAAAGRSAKRAALAAGWRGERVRLRRRVPEASASSDDLPTPAPSAVPFPSSLSAVAQAHPAWSLSRGSDERPCVPRRWAAVR